MNFTIFKAFFQLSRVLEYCPKLCGGIVEILNIVLNFILYSINRITKKRLWANAATGVLKCPLVARLSCLDTMRFRSVALRPSLSAGLPFRDLFILPV